MGADIDNEINKQLQNRLNQNQVATAPLAKKLESGLRGLVPPAPSVTIVKRWRECRLGWGMRGRARERNWQGGGGQYKLGSRKGHTWISV